MRLLSASRLLSPLSSTSFNHPSITPRSSNLPYSLKPRPQNNLSLISASLSSPSTATAATTTVPLIKTSQPLTDWTEFAKRVSGEWDGFGADFTPTGSPIELPENVVPEAYREWDVKVFDWQTQCPTLASETGDPVLSYKLIRLLPTVGCEADAATRHSVDEKTAGGPDNTALGLGYNDRGCYVGVWGVEGFGGKRVLEVESCLVDPRNGEVRVRVVMVLKDGGQKMKLAGVRVFSEQWYGPWRNGEQLGGCAIRESAFARSERVEVEDVVGVWEGRSMSVATFESESIEILVRELTDDRPHRSLRDEEGLIALPKDLWCSLKEKENGETWGEVGWLLERGVALTSRCILHNDGTLKEMAIGEETAALDGT